MKLLKRYISIMVLAAFLVSLVPPEEAHCLAPQDIFSGILAISPQDRIDVLLRLQLTAAMDKTAGAVDLKKLADNADRYGDPVFKTQFFFHEMVKLGEDVVRVRCRIETKRLGTRTYGVLFRMRPSEDDFGIVAYEEDGRRDLYKLRRAAVAPPSPGAGLASGHTTAEMDAVASGIEAMLYRRDRLMQDLDAIKARAKASPVTTSDKAFGVMSDFDAVFAGDQHEAELRKIYDLICARIYDVEKHFLGRFGSDAIITTSIGVTPMPGSGTLFVHITPASGQRDVAIDRAFIECLSALERFIDDGGPAAAEQRAVIDAIIEDSVLHEFGHGFETGSGADLHNLVKNQITSNAYLEFAAVTGYPVNNLGAETERERIKFGEFMADLAVSGPGGLNYIRNRAAYIFFKKALASPEKYMGPAGRDRLMADAMGYFDDNPHLAAALRFVNQEPGLTVFVIASEVRYFYDLFFGKSSSKPDRLVSARTPQNQQLTLVRIDPDRYGGLAWPAGIIAGHTTAENTGDDSVTPDGLFAFIADSFMDADTLSAPKIVAVYQKYHTEAGFKPLPRDAGAALKTVERALFDSPHALLQAGLLEEIGEKGPAGERQFKFTAQGRARYHGINAIKTIRKLWREAGGAEKLLSDPFDEKTKEDAPQNAPVLEQIATLGYMLNDLTAVEVDAETSCMILASCLLSGGDCRGVIKFFDLLKTKASPEFRKAVFAVPYSVRIYFIARFMDAESVKAASAAGEPFLEYCLSKLFRLTAPIDDSSIFAAAADLTAEGIARDAAGIITQYAQRRAFSSGYDHERAMGFLDNYLLCLDGEETAQKRYAASEKKPAFIPQQAAGEVRKVITDAKETIRKEKESIAAVTAAKKQPAKPAEPKKQLLRPLAPQKSQAAKKPAGDKPTDDSKTRALFRGKSLLKEKGGASSGHDTAENAGAERSYTAEELEEAITAAWNSAAAKMGAPFSDEAQAAFTTILHLDRIRTEQNLAVNAQSSYMILAAALYGKGDFKRVEDFFSETLRAADMAGFRSDFFKAIPMQDAFQLYLIARFMDPDTITHAKKAVKPFIVYCFDLFTVPADGVGLSGLMSDQDIVEFPALIDAVGKWLVDRYVKTKDYATAILVIDVISNYVQHEWAVNRGVFQGSLIDHNLFMRWRANIQGGLDAAKDRSLVTGTGVPDKETGGIVLVGRDKTEILKSYAKVQGRVHAPGSIEAQSFEVTRFGTNRYLVVDRGGRGGYLIRENNAWRFERLWTAASGHDTAENAQPREFSFLHAGVLVNLKMRQGSGLGTDWVRIWVAEYLNAREYAQNPRAVLAETTTLLYYPAELWPYIIIGDGKSFSLCRKEGKRTITDIEATLTLAAVSGKEKGSQPKTGISAGHDTAEQVRSASQDDEIAEMASLAGDVGRQEIPWRPDERYLLLVPSEFYADGELKDHQNRYGDRFTLNTINGASVDNILKRAQGIEKRTIALVSSAVSKEDLKRLTDAGVRFIMTDVTRLMEAKSGRDGYRQKFQLDTYVTMLLARRVTEQDIQEHTAVARLLAFYLKSHFELKDRIAIDSYIEAIAKNDVPGIVRGILTYRPIQAYDARADYENVARTLISA